MIGFNDVAIDVLESISTSEHKNLGRRETIGPQHFSTSIIFLCNTNVEVTNIRSNGKVSQLSEQ